MTDLGLSQPQLNGFTRSIWLHEATRAFPPRHTQPGHTADLSFQKAHSVGLSSFAKLPSKSRREVSVFVNVSPALSKGIALSVVILQPIYLPAVAIDKTIFSAQLV